MVVDPVPVAPVVLVPVVPVMLEPVAARLVLAVPASLVLVPVPLVPASLASVPVPRRWRWCRRPWCPLSRPDPVAGSAGLATTGGAAASLPAARGAPWARTEVSGSVRRLGVVVEVRFGSPGSGGVSAATASSIRCWSREPRVALLLAHDLQ